MKLYHCLDARSLRPLWALEEMGLEYELINMPFPPRFSYKGYLDINPLGTVPAFVDGDLTMTESSGICHYLVDKYGPHSIGMTVDEPEYGDYLNWLTGVALYPARAGRATPAAGRGGLFKMVSVTIAVG
jgi:glutathione S-transferase